MQWVLLAKQCFTRAEVSSNSVITAFYLLLSLFPLLVSLGNILPYLHISPDTVLPYINTIVPLGVQPMLNPVITKLLTQSSGGLLSIGAVGLIWSASRVILYLQKGINQAYGIESKKRFFIKRGLSMVVVLLVFILLIAFVLIFGVGQSLLGALGQNVAWVGRLHNYFEELKWPATIVFLMAVLILLYWILPDVKLRLRDIWPGALFCAGGLLLLTQIFTLYTRFTSNSFSGYGAIGVIFGLMFWLQFSCMLILAGAVLNASLYEVHFGKPAFLPSRIDGWVDKKMQFFWGKIKHKKDAFTEKKPPQ